MPLSYRPALALVAACGVASLLGCAHTPATRANLAVAQPAAQPTAQPAGEPAPAPAQAQAQAQPGQDFGMMLVQGLKATPGCLDATAFRSVEGRLGVIAWFENKAAAKRWYESAVHQRLMRGLGTGEAAAEPLAHIADDTPIMVIAAMTMAEPGKTYGMGMPISQISIELFQPLPGGAAVNGRFSPAAFPVEHMRNMTMPARDQ